MRVFANWQENEFNLSVEEIDFFGPSPHLLKLDFELGDHLFLKYHIGHIVERVLLYGRLCKLFHKEGVENVSLLSHFLRQYIVLNELHVEEYESIIQVLLWGKF